MGIRRQDMSAMKICSIPPGTLIEMVDEDESHLQSTSKDENG
jgi:hypothetical protein